MKNYPKRALQLKVYGYFKQLLKGIRLTVQNDALLVESLVCLLPQYPIVIRIVCQISQLDIVTVQRLDVHQILQARQA